MSRSADARGFNRLRGASSPYLLQHAHNPVDWHTWGREAFAEARRRDVPILLSVGYSTCHWCHVMERECFEDQAIARVMNDRFVCVKVDREERPDVDDLYMNALLVARGTGGWPMNVFLEPHRLRPFWCGTYFPPSPRQGMPSWTQVLEGISQAWLGSRSDVIEQAERVAEAVRENLASAVAPCEVGGEQVSAALQSLISTFDRINGGFGGAPKFPQPAYLEFLLDVRSAAGDDQTKDAIEACLVRTLDAMLTGGIHDQVAGGFHRYSVDGSWTVPHFEKMLYDNAQLASVYARAARDLGGGGEYERVARGTIGYVLRELTGPRGQFFSAQDADAAGREGLHHVWTPAEVHSALSGMDESDRALAMRLYGLDAGPNFQDPHHPESEPANVLRLADRLDRLAPSLDMPPEALRRRVEAINRELLGRRSRRPAPSRDDKAVAAWNGMMISALCTAHVSLGGEARFLAAAQQGARFLLETMIDDAGRCVRSWRDGVASGQGFLEDSAAVVRALVDVARASGQSVPWIAAAERVAARAVEDFRESVPGGTVRWCDTRDGQEDLFVRTSSTHDGVMPGGPSLMLDALLSLAELTGRDAWRREAGLALVSLSGVIAGSAVGSIHATRGLLRALTDPALKPMLASSASASTALPGGTATPGVEDHARDRDRVPAAPLRERSMAVEVYAAVDRVRVGPDHPAEFGLVLRISDGHHVVAADPGPGGEGLVPLRVGIVNGAGVVAYADYPAGTPLQEGLLVHEGTIELSVVIEHVAPWTGRPLVSLTYQACTKTECLLPVTVELDVSLERA